MTRDGRGELIIVIIIVIIIVTIIIINIVDDGIGKGKKRDE